MEMLTEERTTQRQMAIVERFEGFIAGVKAAAEGSEP